MALHYDGLAQSLTVVQAVVAAESNDRVAQLACLQTIAGYKDSPGADWLLVAPLCWGRLSDMVRDAEALFRFEGGIARSCPPRSMPLTLAAEAWICLERHLADTVEL